MATLDLRNEDNGAVDKIIFGRDGEYLRFNPDYHDLIDFKDDISAEEVTLYIRDIPTLIKALQKAQELWASTGKKD